MLTPLLGSARVAAAMVGTSCALGVVLAFLAKLEVLSVWQTFVVAAGLATGAFGAGIGASSDSLELSLGFAPLTITIVTLAVGVIAFRRRRGTLIDASVAAILTAIAMTIVAAVLRTSEQGFDAGPNPLSTFVMALVVTALVLAGSTLTTYERLRAPLIGLAYLTLALPLAGGIALACYWLTGDASGLGDLGARHEVALGIAYAGNAGVGALALGSLGDLGRLGFDQLGGVIENVTGLDADFGGRLGAWTAEAPGLWVCVALAPALLAVALVAARRAGGWQGLLTTVAALVVAVPVLIRVANLHVDVDAGLIGDDGGLGVRWLTATALIVAYAAILAVIVEVVTRLRGTRPSMPPQRRRSAAGDVTGSGSRPR